MIHVLHQDAGISCLVASKLKNKQDNVILFGDREGKLSYLDLETLQVTHFPVISMSHNFEENMDYISSSKVGFPSFKVKTCKTIYQALTLLTILCK